MVAASTNGGGLETSPSVSRGRVSGVVSEERDWDRENEELEKVMRDERGGDRRIGSRHASVLQRSGSAGSGTLSIQPLRPGSAVVSRGSDTEKMIIRKEIEYSVEYGDNEMGTKEALGTENWGVCFRETNR